MSLPVNRLNADRLERQLLMPINVDLKNEDDNQTKNIPKGAIVKASLAITS